MHFVYFQNLSIKVHENLKKCPNLADVVLVLISKWQLISKILHIIKALTVFLILNNRTIKLGPSRTQNVETPRAKTCVHLNQPDSNKWIHRDPPCGSTRIHHMDPPRSIIGIHQDIELGCTKIQHWEQSGSKTRIHKDTQL